MINYKIENNRLIITYTIIEPTTKDDPFYLQNLMYDIPFDLKQFDTFSIDITIPESMTVSIIDDLHTINIKSNAVAFTLKAKSQLSYQLFIANHHFCDSCIKKIEYDCQNIPDTFSKNLSVTMIEPEAQAYIKCHYLSDRESNFSITTNQNHQASNTTSKLIVKSVLDNKAQLQTNNTITIPAKLQNIIAEQENKNLVLSSKAHVISIPQLKVRSKKVSCKHGATISTINKKDLFYLQSRGISQHNAEYMLINGFFTVKG